MKQKIIFFDIDGTLYDGKIGIPQSTKDAITILRERGHIPVICTGRTKAMIFEDVRSLKFDGIIAGCGTYIEFQGNVLFQADLPAKLVAETVKMLQKHRFVPIPEGCDAIYFNESDVADEHLAYLRQLKDKLPCRIEPIDFDKMKAAKISAWYQKDSDYNGLYSQLKEHYTFIDHKSKTLELVPKGYSKATGIDYLINKLGISREDTYAFGDSTNDLDMLLFVKYGIAMGNSYPEVLEQTKYKTTSITEDGIYQGLKVFGLI